MKPAIYLAAVGAFVFIAFAAIDAPKAASGTVLIKNQIDSVGILGTQALKKARIRKRLRGRKLRRVRKLRRRVRRLKRRVRRLRRRQDFGWGGGYSSSAHTHKQPAPTVEIVLPAPPPAKPWVRPRRWARNQEPWQRYHWPRTCHQNRDRCQRYRPRGFVDWSGPVDVFGPAYVYQDAPKAAAE